MTAPLIVFWDKGKQATDAPDQSWRDDQPAFAIDSDQRVWLAGLGDEVLGYDWDAFEPDLCLPEVWQPSLLSTSAFGSGFAPNVLSPVHGGPLVGDRVVAVHAETASVLGVWVVTGTRCAADGEATLGLRPLVSCLTPVALVPALAVDDDLAEWAINRGVTFSANTLELLDGPGLIGIMRTVGFDPRLVVGAVDELPRCALTNNVPTSDVRRPASRVRLVDSSEGTCERRAVAEATSWLLAELAPGPDTEVEATGVSAGAGRHLVARSVDAVVEAVAIGTEVTEIRDLELCPTIVREARDAVARGRKWWVIVTLDAFGAGRTIALEALAVAMAFDPLTGAVAVSSNGQDGGLEG